MAMSDVGRFVPLFAADHHSGGNHRRGAGGVVDHYHVRALLCRAAAAAHVPAAAPASATRSGGRTASAQPPSAPSSQATPSDTAQATRATPARSQARPAICCPLRRRTVDRPAATTDAPSAAMADASLPRPDDQAGRRDAGSQSRFDQAAAQYLEPGRTGERGHGHGRSGYRRAAGRSAAERQNPAAAPAAQRSRHGENNGGECTDAAAAPGDRRTIA